MNWWNAKKRAGAALLAALLPGLPLAAADQPNIVHIFADDLGWGSVGFNGQTAIQTPHLDALAARGMTFSNAYAATVCGPSRAMLLSGFHNGHTLVDSNQNLNGDTWRDDGQTVGDQLQAAGYSTALFGKWGFGGTGSSSEGLNPNPTIDGPNSIPPAQGFETFYGYLDHARAHSYRVDSLWTTEEPADDDGDGIDEVGEKYASQPNTDLGMWLEKTGNNNANPNTNYSADLVTLKSREYIQTHANSDTPFYLQYSSTLPHFDIDAIRNTPGWFDAYADVPGSAAWTDDQKAYAAMITHLDDAVGQLVDQLRDPNGDGDASDSVLADTLILFTSDNGATPEDGSPIDFFNASGGKRGGKRDLWDGGINVPALAYWEGTIAPGQTSDLYTDLPDFAPTALELAGREARVGADGVSIVHELTGRGSDRHKDWIVQEHHEGNGPDPDGRDGRWAILRDGYKLIKFSNGDLDLYDLENDADENAPLGFGDQANAALRDELRQIALAEGVEENDSYTVDFQDWIGGADADFNDATNWAGTAPPSSTPNARWSAVLNNTSGEEAVAQVGRHTAVLGLEVRGDGARQTLRVNRLTSLTGRNEVRISEEGRLQLDVATLSTVRWVDVKQGGELTGQGLVEGDVYNWGTVSPGLPADLSQPSAPPAPPQIPQGVDTGVVTAIRFDFNGVQDAAPLTSTTAKSQHLDVVAGLDFGPGVGARHPGGGDSDAGDEFNVSGYQSGGSIDSAIDAQDYLAFTVDAVYGVEMLVDTVEFQYRRNGVNTARRFGVMTSLDGFTAGQELAASSLHYENDVGTHTLSGAYTGGVWTQDPVEVRFYGWDANTADGNTHVNAASMTASFRTITAEDAVVFDFAGQGDGQNAAPLLATSARSENLQVVSGLDLGPGLAFKDTESGTDNGNEFNVSSFTGAASLEDALTAGDYLTYTVQSVPGVEMQVREISFELWRNGINAPNAFAIMSSQGGFDRDHLLGVLSPVPKDDGSSANPSDQIGFDARTTVATSVVSDAWTSDPVEVRLYGWGANDASGNAHITGAAMKAFFRSNGEAGPALRPTGVLTLAGDFFHVEGGLIDIELGGVDQSLLSSPSYDQILVSGAVELAGDLRVSLVDDFTPLWGDAFAILDADGLEGEFAAVDATDLDPQLGWGLTYSQDGVLLEVVAAGDFNRDGVVDAADYTVWRDSHNESVAAYTGADADGDGLVGDSDYAIWRNNFGFVGSSSMNAAVPEPGAVGLLLAIALPRFCSRRPTRTSWGGVNR